MHRTRIYGGRCNVSWRICIAKANWKGIHVVASQNSENRGLNAGLASTVKIGELTINRMAYGTMKLTDQGGWGYPQDMEEARRVLRRAVELGINYVDTAAYYGPLVTDRLIYEALYPYPPGLVIGTKVGGWRGSDRSWMAELHARQLRGTVEDNIQRLHLPALPLVHLRYLEHTDVPFVDALGTMAELQKEGKILNIGLSGVTLEQIKTAQKMIQVADVQNLYNLADRRDEPILDYCTQQGIPFMPFFPLALGRLGSGVGPLKTIAQSHDATPAQIALAWLLMRSPQMVLIPGTTSVAHLEENIAAANIHLSKEEWQELAASAEVAAIPGYRF